MRGEQDSKEGGRKIPTTYNLSTLKKTHHHHQQQQQHLTPLQKQHRYYRTIQTRLLILKAFLVLTALFAFAIGALRLGGGTGFEASTTSSPTTTTSTTSSGSSSSNSGGVLAGLYVVACVSLMGQLQGLFSKRRQWKWRLVGLLNGCSLLVSLAMRFSLLEACFGKLEWLGAKACQQSVILDILLFGLLGLRRRLFERGFGVQLGRYWQLMKMQSLAREHANRERRKWLEKVTQIEVTIAYFKRQLRYYERWKQRSAPNLSKGVSLVLDECGIDLDLKHATMDSIAGVVRSLEAKRAAMEDDPAAAPLAGNYHHHHHQNHNNYHQNKIKRYKSAPDVAGRGGEMRGGGNEDIRGDPFQQQHSHHHNQRHHYNHGKMMQKPHQQQQEQQQQQQQPNHM
mmetsp:Transcript_2957/g.4631  ORF Transcript_2957/g.4631 Transcript_2957/m.4631 type:complete len:397 (+) Transcript_2957:437-1627(+)